MTHRTPLGLRLSLFYAAVFCVIGVQLPFWPLYLSSKGLDASQIGQILAAGYFVKIVTNPLVGHVVDRRGDRRRPLIALAMASTAATALFAMTQGFAPLLAVTLLSAAAFTAMMPLGDSLTMLGAVSHRLDYGRVRLWGSLSFIAASSLAGALLVDAPRPAILWSAVAALLLTLAAVTYLPDIRVERPATRPQPMLPLLTNRRFLLFLAAASCIQVGHMIYYGFATLHWRAAGLSGTIIGALWAEGVIAEVVLFAFGARLVARLGPEWLLSAAAVAGVIRWTVLAFTTDPWALASVQFLHAFTFGACHLGAMHFINRSAPAGLSARAQGVYSSVTVGVVPGLAMLVSGTLYQHLGGYAFLTMTAVSVVGFAISLVLGKNGQQRAVIMGSQINTDKHR